MTMNEVIEPTNRRRVLVAFLSDITCGEPCWHAKEEICRCSCGGKNHGCLLNADGSRPVRTAKIDGQVYELAAVGSHRDLIGEAGKINAAFSPYSGSTMKAYSYTEEKEVTVRYHYHWKETDAHAPARLKGATAPQISNWPELAAFLDVSERPYLLWRRVEMPAPYYCADGLCEKCEALKALRA